MALPTIQYFRYGTAEANSSTLAKVMTKLHDLLIAAGWTIVYADTDAIGTGSSGTPAWSKTPVTNTDGGIAVYRMPANGLTTQWFVRFRPGWAGSTTRFQIRGLTVGPTHDGSGAVSGSGAELTTSGSTVTTDSSAFAVATSEDGFCLDVMVSGTHVCVLVERARLADGTVTDDVVVYVAVQASGSGRVLSATAGEVSTDVPIALAGVNGSAQTASPPTTGRSVTEVIVAGPYFGGMFPLAAPPRLMIFAAASDVSQGSMQAFDVDGGLKAYQAAVTGAGNGPGMILLATE